MNYLKYETVKKYMTEKQINILHGLELEFEDYINDPDWPSEWVLPDDIEYMIEEFNKEKEMISEMFPNLI